MEKFFLQHSVKCVCYSGSWLSALSHSTLDVRCSSFFPRLSPTAHGLSPLAYSPKPIAYSLISASSVFSVVYLFYSEFWLLTPDFCFYLSFDVGRPMFDVPLFSLSLHAPHLPLSAYRPVDSFYWPEATHVIAFRSVAIRVNPCPHSMFDVGSSVFNARLFRTSLLFRLYLIDIYPSFKIRNLKFKIIVLPVPGSYF